MATLPSWGDYFDISMELWIESYSGGDTYGWTELLRFTATNNNCCSAGDRIPVIFANKDGFVSINVEVSQNGTNTIAYKRFNIPTQTWTKVEIKQYQENGKVYNINNILTIQLRQNKYSAKSNLLFLTLYSIFWTLE